ncbi:MFS Git1p-related glycerophosphoinositol and glycerophosphocholine permease [Rhizoctonia solani AG-1 IA]|uniref:MFS Git1p-related glycerophosphoinositol and glycerophosphocholine permease n=1 Tax=Thanatephorus cucumeris (strain AG1-IA) TaxID=983506 RepID=L8WUI4_THACA|nr:MFS Git1p-related glycerophosphoinositol and glycerophosphocholine permease [Rhizoctonia solani AG-1 IA]
MADPTPAPKKLGLSQVSLIFAHIFDSLTEQTSPPTALPRCYQTTRLWNNTLVLGICGDYCRNAIDSGASLGWQVPLYLHTPDSNFQQMSATLIVAVFSFLSACSAGAHGSTGGMLAMLSACRQVGAEYPSGSVAASEQSEEEGIAKNAYQNSLINRGVDTMIDTGFVISAFTPLVLLWIFGENHLRAVWRGSLGLGTIPALAVLVWRLRMSEPTRYRQDSMRNAKTPYLLIVRRYWKSLAAISITWFIYDFITYPFGIYSSTVVDSIIGGTDSLYVIFGWNVVINLFYIPGTLTGAFIVDFLGPKYTMVLYGIFLSFGELGPGNCLGLLASKSGPTAVRGQFYGIAAAIGKVGAFVGTWVLSIMVTNRTPLIGPGSAFGGASSTRGNTGPFWVGSGLAILSALITLAFIRPLSHDGMMDEDAKVCLVQEYLAKHGYDTSKMGAASTGDVDSVEAQTLGTEKEKGSM